MPAGYRMYAATPADFVGSGQVGAPLIITASILTVWDARTAGTQITDLLDASELAVAQVATDSFGNFRFYAPDTYGTLWVTAGTAQRYAVQPAELGGQVKTLQADVATMQTTITGLGDVAQVDTRLDALEGAGFLAVKNGTTEAAWIVDGTANDPTDEEIATRDLVVVLA